MTSLHERYQQSTAEKQTQCNHDVLHCVTTRYMSTVELVQPLIQSSIEGSRIKLRAYYVWCSDIWCIVLCLVWGCCVLLWDVLCCAIYWMALVSQQIVNGKGAQGANIHQKNNTSFSNLKISQFIWNSDSETKNLIVYFTCTAMSLLNSRLIKNSEG